MNQGRIICATTKKEGFLKPSFFVIPDSVYG